MYKVKLLIGAGLFAGLFDCSLNVKWVASRRLDDDYSSPLALWLPQEVYEKVLSFARPADWLSMADLSEADETKIRSEFLWRHTRVHLSGAFHDFDFRKLNLAPKLLGVHVHEGVVPVLIKEHIDSNLAEGIDPPAVTELHIAASAVNKVNDALAMMILGWFFGQATALLELDLRAADLQEPRYHFNLINAALALERNVGGHRRKWFLRLDQQRDIIFLIEKAAVDVTMIDIHRLNVDPSDSFAVGAASGEAAAKLISLHTSTLDALRLPHRYDPHIPAAVAQCQVLTSFATNIKSLLAVENLKTLKELVVFPPDEHMTQPDLVEVLNSSHRLESVLNRIQTLKLFKADERDKIPIAPSVDLLRQALGFILPTCCEDVQVVMIHWKIPDEFSPNWLWMDSLLLANPTNLQELHVGGNFVSARNVITLHRYCPNLKILDVRRSLSFFEQEPKPILTRTTMAASVGMRRAIQYLHRSFDNLTVIYDDNADNSFDWSHFDIYAGDEEEDDGPPRTPEPEPEPEPFPFERYFPGASDEYCKLFMHLLPIDEWITSGRFRTSIREEFRYWRCSTIDALVWPVDRLCQYLRYGPAFGFVDCRNRGKRLSPGKKGLMWMQNLFSGTHRIRSLGLTTSMVRHDHFVNLPPFLLRCKEHLLRLELDFRGRVKRDYESVLSIFKHLTRLRSLVLRGKFDDDTPVLNLLHGALTGLKLLDLRDCLMARSDQRDAFVESFETLACELRPTLKTLMLPPLPHNDAQRVTSFVLQTFPNLEGLGIHMDVVECLSVTEKKCVRLDIYGQHRRKWKNPEGAGERFARSLRRIRPWILQMEKLSLPLPLFEQEVVKEALRDTMPKLRRLEVLGSDRKLKVCAKGPQCKTLLTNL